MHFRSGFQHYDLQKKSNYFIVSIVWKLGWFVSPAVDVFSRFVYFPEILKKRKFRLNPSGMLSEIQKK